MDWFEREAEQLERTRKLRRASDADSELRALLATHAGSQAGRQAPSTGPVEGGRDPGGSFQPPPEHPASPQYRGASDVVDRLSARALRQIEGDPDGYSVIDIWVRQLRKGATPEAILDSDAARYVRKNLARIDEWITPSK